MTEPKTTKREFVEQKNFAYSRGSCNLSFSLRTDIKQEMKDFIELLKVALADVEEELKKK